MHRAFVAGVVLFATSVAHAEQPKTSYNFSGQLAYRTTDGVLIPMFPDAIYVGRGDRGCELGRQTSERINVYPDGKFHLWVDEEETFTGPVTGGQEPRTTDTTRTWPCYRFRAAGCVDAVVEFGPKPPDSVIELKCPDRGRK
jgi:hypothetical protein